MVGDLARWLRDEEATCTAESSCRYIKISVVKFTDLIEIHWPPNPIYFT